nr:hypothetical protein [Tanacetum cinerariifolium]
MITDGCCPKLQLHNAELADVLKSDHHPMQEESKTFLILLKLCTIFSIHYVHIRGTLIHIFKLQIQRGKQAVEDIRRCGISI